jgi:glutamate carboxypeptidase
MTLDPSLKDKIVKAVEDTFESAQVPALAKLVNQPSHTYAPDDVEAASTILDGMVSEVDLEVSGHASGDAQFADHRVYASKSAAADDAPCLALVGHMDTVFPRSSGFLEYKRDGDVARGPGVLDMKSGLTAIVFALRAVKTVLPEEYEALPVNFICVSDEEVGSPTSRHLYDRMAKSISHALVFEKGRDEDRIVVSRKGGGTFTVEVEGKAAHAGNHHEKGVNAIHALSLLIPQIEALTDYEKGVTVNVGLMNGGTSKNTVPPNASCTIDARFLTTADAEAFEDKLQALVEKPLGNERLKDANFRVSGNVTRPPMETTDEIQALCARYGEHAKSVGLGSGQAPRQGGFSDSNLIAALGIPTVDGLGPWGEGAHSVDEWCSLKSLLKRTQALALFVAEEAQKA